jgi:hypothetical protein
MEMKNVYRILVAKYEWRRPLWKPIHRWKVNIKVELKAIECEDIGWIHLAQDRVQ